MSSRPWTVDAAGQSRWTEVDDETAPALAPGEREFSMWRLPPRADDCAAGRTRSLWFRMVPTSSGERDDADGTMLDDRSIYRVRCFARVQRPSEQEDCPPWLWWSAPTAAYRLAAFYDPQGTKNRRTTMGVAFVADVDPAGATGVDPTPEPVPDDPLCLRD